MVAAVAGVAATPAAAQDHHDWLWDWRRAQSIIELRMPTTTNIAATTVAVPGREGTGCAYREGLRGYRW